MIKVDQLPSELVSLILSYIDKRDLPSCALVNKSFYREALPLLWRTLDIGSTTIVAISNCLMQTPHGHHVRSLIIRNMEAVQDVLNFERLGRIQHTPRYCPHLTTLEIQCGRNPDRFAYWIAQATIASVGQYCKQLTKLDLHNCAYSNYDDLFDALKDAPLTEIRLYLPRELDEEISQRFLETAPLTLHRYPLTSLWINANNDTTSFINTINTHGLTWPHLTEFRLRFCESLTNAMALTFVQTNPTIERLDLGCSEGIGDAFLDGLVDYLPNLTTLYVDFTAITAPGICRLITNYGGLNGRVYCEGCDIYPENVPNDKTYHYHQVEFGGYLDVEWFDGTFS